MRADQLDDLRRNPFIPFRLTTSGGRVYTVLDPEQILITQNTTAVGTSDGVIAVLDNSHIVSAMTIDPTAGEGGT